MGFPCGSAGKESTCNEGDLSSIPGLGRSPGEGKGNPLQYSGVENSMDCIVHGVAKSQTWLSNFHFTLVSISPTCHQGQHLSIQPWGDPKGLNGFSSTLWDSSLDWLLSTLGVWGTGSREALLTHTSVTLMTEYFFTECSGYWYGLHVNSKLSWNCMSWVQPTFEGVKNNMTCNFWKSSKIPS